LGVPLPLQAQRLARDADFSRAHGTFLSYGIGVMIAPEGLAQLVRQAQAGNRPAEACFGPSLSLREVAERLHLSYDKVRERYHAGLRFLERQLDGHV